MGIWNRRAVLVTGGASFIGSHLVDKLVELGADVRVVDDLSSGRRANLDRHSSGGRVEFVQADLRQSEAAAAAVRDVDVAFHLAAIHGGRGFIDRHQADCSQNLIIDGNLFRAACEAQLDKVVYASSGCVYPVNLQMDVGQEVYLSEEAVGPPYEADDSYGWAKLMGELSLRAYHNDYGLRSAACRLFTVYGERCTENHALIAMIGRAFLRQDPFEVWGDGSQVRNWTHVDDIVSGFILAAEKIDDASAVNLGTEERIRVIDAVREILRHTGHEAEIALLTHMPTGPLNRVASNRRAAELLGWRPQISFRDGLHRTIEWYYSTKDPDQLRNGFKALLLDR
ncbi:MAG: SDR family NAD(P)-dependent oxidoreductase [Candidatus Promineifilaceae bacterium]